MMILPNSLLIIFLSFFVIEGQAKILEYEVTGTKKENYSLQEVCRDFGHQNLLMVEEKGKKAIDCMGSEVQVKNFCLKKWSETGDLLQGFVREGKVYCITGKQVQLKYSCEQKDDPLCRTAKKGCLKLKEILAYQLPLMHFSLLDDQTLNCIFVREDYLLDSNILEKSLL